MEPDSGDAIEGRAHLFDAFGRTTEARVEFERARKVRAEIRLGPPDRCYVARRRGTFDSQVAAFSSVIANVRVGVMPLVARGNAYLAGGRPVEALADYEQALELLPGSLDTWALRGEALLILGRLEDAVRDFEHVLSARADDGDCLSGRAIARLGLGDVEAANADWRRQLELLPPERSSARACVALRLADYHAALPDLEQALLKKPSDPYWRLYRLTARRRLDRATEPADGGLTEAWPGPLIALHAGRLAEEEVLGRADMEGRRIEALFQLGVVAFARDRNAAVRRWQEVVRDGAPSLIEYAAARNELSRLGS